MAGLAFFAVNCWVLGIMVGDMGDGFGSKVKGGGKKVLEGDTVRHSEKRE